MRMGYGGGYDDDMDSAGPCRAKCSVLAPINPADATPQEKPLMVMH